MSPDDGAPAGALDRIIAAVSRIALVGAEIILMLMLAMMASEVIVRNLFNHSLEVTDELAGYFLVALTFLALGVSLHDGAFFRVQFIFERLPRRIQHWVACAFTALSILFVGILDWQLFKLVQSSFRRGNVEPTLLATPLWIPQTVMPIGMTLLLLVLIAMFAKEIAALVAGEPGRRP